MSALAAMEASISFWRANALRPPVPVRGLRRRRPSAPASRGISHSSHALPKAAFSVARRGLQHALGTAPR